MLARWARQCTMQIDGWNKLSCDHLIIPSASFFFRAIFRGPHLTSSHNLKCELGWHVLPLNWDLFHVNISNVSHLVMSLHGSIWRKHCVWWRCIMCMGVERIVNGRMCFDSSIGSHCPILFNGHKMRFLLIFYKWLHFGMFRGCWLSRLYSFCEEDLQKHQMWLERFEARCEEN